MMLDPYGRHGRAQIGIMTVTTAEAEVIDAVFNLDHQITGTAYTTDSAPETKRFRIVHSRMPHQTNMMSVQTAGDLIEDFRPQFLVLIGTAGGHSGRDGLCLGDVVVADYVDCSGYWKYQEDKVLERKIPHDHPSGHLLKNYVEGLRRKPQKWINKIQADRPIEGMPKLIVGGIASGNILYGDSNNQEQRRILKHFDKAYAFEMEAYGVSLAVFNARNSVHYNPQYLVVRGISDLVDKDPKENQAARVAWTEYAVAAAAAFASTLLEDFFQVTDAAAVAVVEGKSNG